NPAAHPAVWRNKSSCQNSEKVRARARPVPEVHFCKVLDHNTSWFGVSNRRPRQAPYAAMQKNAAWRPRKHSAIGGGWGNDLQPSRKTRAARVKPSSHIATHNASARPAPLRNLARGEAAEHKCF